MSLSYIAVPKSCDEQSTLCVPHRRGQLCGEYEEGYTAYFHSESYVCGKCEYGAKGLLIYIIAELIPLVILFFGYNTMKLKMISEVMQSLVLFAQIITLINNTPSFIQVPKKVSYSYKNSNISAWVFELTFV